MIRSLKHRLEKLEARIISREGPWPPEPATFGYWLWLALGRPEHRRGHFDMYLERASQFWKDQK